MHLDTASNIINDALLELALVAEALADPYTSTDGNVVVMRAHLKALGRSLARRREWSHLTGPYTFSTVNGTDNYALPSDFASMVTESEWNRSTALPLGGPVQAQGWELLKSSGTVSPINYFYRLYNNRLYLHPTPTTAETIAFEYVGRYWVQPDGQSSRTSETPTASTDTLWFDSRLLVCGLKLRFLTGKGFDSTAAEGEYTTELAAAEGNDGAHAVLRLDAAARTSEPRPRLPETGWGV